MGTPFELPPAACVGCGTCARICPTECIPTWEDGRVRHIWDRDFPFVHCDVCGRPVMTEGGDVPSPSVRALVRSTALAWADGGVDGIPHPALDATVASGHGYRAVVGAHRQVEAVPDLAGDIRTRRRESRLDTLEIGWGDPCRADDVFGSSPGDRGR